MIIPLTNVILTNPDRFTLPSAVYGFSFVDNNQYIPVFAVRDSRVYKQGEQKTIMYNYGDTQIPRTYLSQAARTRNLNQFMASLHVNNTWNKSAYFDELSIVFRKTNFLYTNDGTILLALCLPVNKVYTLTKESRINNKDVILLRNIALDNDPKYKTLNKSINAVYMEHIRDTKIDVLNSDDIRRFMFNSVGLTPTFSSIEEMTDYLSNIRTFIYGNNQPASSQS